MVDAILTLMEQAFSPRPGRQSRRLWLSVLLPLVAISSAIAQPATTNQVWSYRLMHDSNLLDDCPICDRVSIPVAMRGTFSLRLIDANPLFSRYAIDEVDFRAGSNRVYTVKGSGTLEIGGEVAVTIQVFLQAEINDGFTNKTCYFTNVDTHAQQPWPMLDISLSQTNGTLGQLFSMRMFAAPLRDAWFSTAGDFTWVPVPDPVYLVSNGDLLSMSGGKVKSIAELVASVGAEPPGSNAGLDAVDVLAGGEIAFSLGTNLTSQTLGQLQHGDLLSNRGRVLRTNQDLLAPFAIQPPAPDVGLDAVHRLEDGRMYFSIATDIFSEQLGMTLHHGDLLSSTGAVVMTNQQLLSHFHPTKPGKDYGLDALYVWPGGELWFSTQEAFEDQTYGTVSAGDLLSNLGYIVFRNAELLEKFSPADGEPEPGLDALYVVTDVTPPAPAPELDISLLPSVNGVRLRWESQARVFQVLRADDISGPFLPVSPLLSEPPFDDPAALTTRGQGWYRLQQW